MATTTIDELITVPAKTLDDLCEAAQYLTQQLDPNDPMVDVLRGCVSELRAGSRTSPRFEGIPARRWRDL